MAKSNNESYRSPWGTSPGPAPRKITPPEPSRGGRTFAVIATLAVVIAAASFLYFRQQRGPNVGLEFVKPNQMLLGDPFTLPVSFSNYSESILKNVKLSLFLPDGVSFVGQSQGQRVMEQTVGDFGPGSINQQSFNLIVTDGANALKHLEAKISYVTAENPNTQFENSSGADLLVGQPAVSLNLSAPQNIFNDQDFEIKMDYANNTSHDFKNIHLKLDFPANFHFKRSTMQPDNDNNSWNLGTLSSGSGGTITVTGSVIGAEKSFFNINGSVTSDFLGETYAINTQPASIAISAAPLSIEAILNNTEDYVANSGDSLTYTLKYTNNSSIVMQDINISAKLIGEMFDFGSLQSDASFNSLSNAVNWFGANTPELANLAPGQSGSVNLRIKLKDSYPIRLLSDKNYTLKLQAQVESPTVPPNTTANKTISLVNLENKVGGKLGLAAEAYWRDAASGILNDGPYSPRVNQPTQYTIHWRVTNYATDVTNISLTAFLQSGSRFTGKVKSNIDSAPTYNSNSGLVTWQINSLAATKGVISSPAEAVFQIENTPASNQISQIVPLIGETKIEGSDSFTGLLLQSSAQALDTSLPYDKTIPSQTEKAVKQ